MSERSIRKRSRGRPRTAATESAGTTVQALDRSLALLGALARSEKLTLTELSLRMGMPPSSAHRLLMTLQKHGFVEFDEASQGWMIGIEAFRIGSAFAQRTNLVEAGREVMRALMEETGETANLAIPDGGDVVFISQVETQNPIRAFFPPGTRVPMHASGIGKALLASLTRREVEAILTRKGLREFTPKTLTSPDALIAELEAIRRRGWSLDDEEHNSGMRCVAAPIYNAYGEAAAGISVSGPAARLPDPVIAELGPKLRRAAAELTRTIGGKLPEPG
jgi:IclR family transcriptional regulator, acetate operon repressor